MFSLLTMLATILVNNPINSTILAAGLGARGNPITILWARASSKTILVAILLFWSQSGISTGFWVDFSKLLHQAPKNPSGLSDRDCTS